MTRSSFSGALRLAMHSFEPPLTALDVSLLTGTLSEEAVGELLSGETGQSAPQPLQALGLKRP